jgi:hypothetical protein
MAGLGEPVLDAVLQANALEDVDQEPAARSALRLAGEHQFWGTIDRNLQKCLTALVSQR